MNTAVAPPDDELGTGAVDGRTALPHQPGVLALIRDLAALLDEERVSYCQWKGAGAPARWRTGMGDIDLLVEHTHADRFRSCVTRLRLKRAVPAYGTVPGIESYLGFDAGSGRVVHIHIYYRLLIGSPQSTLYALPLERPLLEATSVSGVFLVPRPDLQLIVSALHRLLSERFPAALLRRSTHTAPADVARLRDLAAAECVAQTLGRHLPELPYPLFERCLRALAAPRSIARRAWLRMRVRRVLRAHAVSGTGPGWRHTIARRLPGAVGARAASADGKRLATGGLVVALVGGDGAGKSTCARALTAWLSPELATGHFHLGRPPRSLFTLAVGALLRLARGLRRERLENDFEHAVPAGVTGILLLLRELAAARDRYRLYERVRNSAGDGRVAVCERYPIPENRLLVGPRRSRARHATSADPAILARASTVRRRLVDRLMALEAAYYERIAAPDVVLVLRLAPELAVQRKPEEPADYVRRRTAVIWNTDWSGTRAVVIDAAQPLPAMIASLEEVVWRHL